MAAKAGRCSIELQEGPLHSAHDGLNTDYELQDVAFD